MNNILILIKERFINPDIDITKQIKDYQLRLYIKGCWLEGHKCLNFSVNLFINLINKNFIFYIDIFHLTFQISICTNKI